MPSFSQIKLLLRNLCRYQSLQVHNYRRKLFTDKIFAPFNVSVFLMCYKYLNLEFVFDRVALGVRCNVVFFAKKLLYMPHFIDFLDRIFYCAIFHKFFPNRVEVSIEFLKICMWNVVLDKILPLIKIQSVLLKR